MFLCKYFPLILFFIFYINCTKSSDTIIVNSYVLPDGDLIPFKCDEYFGKHKNLIDSIKNLNYGFKRIKPFFRRLHKISPNNFENLKINDNYYSLLYEKTKSLGGDKEEYFSLQNNGVDILKLIVLTPQPVDPIYSFFAWDGKWVLEYYKNVLIDGIYVNKKYRFDETFYATKLKDNLIYFAKKNDKIYIVNNNVLTDHFFDEVMVYLCCGYSIFNPSRSNDILSFYAKKDNQTYLVQIFVNG